MLRIPPFFIGIYRLNLTLLFNSRYELEVRLGNLN